MAKKSKSKSPTELAKDISGYLQSKALDQQVGYLQRGRSQRHLTDAELTDNWVTAFQGWAALDRDNRSYLKLRQYEEDLSSEMTLRSIPVPQELVKEAMAKLVAAADASLKALEKEPGALEARNEEILGDIDAFKAARDKPKN